MAPPKLLLLLLPLLAGCPGALDRSAPGPAPLVALEQRLASRGLPAARALEVAEAIKCRHLRQRLLAVGAQPHALPPMNKVSPPPLAEGELGLAFFQQGKLYRRWLLRPEGVAALPPLDAEAVDRLVAVARDTLEHGRLQAPAAGGPMDRLARLLLGGAEGALEHGQRLLVLPDGLTRLVPFHALPLRGEPLVQHLPVTRAPCLALAGAAPARRGEALLMVPRYDNDPDHMTGARQEIEALASLHPLARVVRGRAATPWALAGGLARPLDLVHFAGHGLADLAPGSAPELLFADGSSLGLAGATGRLVRTGLVVLAACSGGQAALFRDGPARVAEVTLSDALLAAGAGAVVAASWLTKDRLTALQMATLHRGRRSRSLDQAVRHAQLWLRDRLAGSEPRFWAPFALYGGWARP